MSTIAHLFNKSIIVKRLRPESGNKRQMHSTGTIDGHVQRLDEHTDTAAQNVYGATHKAWVDISEDVQDGDDAVIGSERFSVIAVIEKEPGIAINEHKELIMRRYSS